MLLSWGGVVMERNFIITKSRGKHGGYFVKCEECSWSTSRPTEEEAWSVGRQHEESDHRSSESEPDT
jgi:hypothetical protein